MLPESNCRLSNVWRLDYLERNLVELGQASHTILRRRKTKYMVQDAPDVVCCAIM